MKKGETLVMVPSKFMELLEHSALLNSEAIKSSYSLIQVNHQLLYEMTVKLADSNLTQSKLRILIVLYLKNKPMKPSELAEYIELKRSTVTGLLNGLEKSGYIKRQQHDDGRAMNITLTASCLEMIESLIPSYIKLIDSYMSELTQQDYEDLARILGKIQRGMEKTKEG